MGKNHTLTLEEKNIRQEEEKFFTGLRKPPTKIKGVADILGEKHRTKDIIWRRGKNSKIRCKAISSIKRKTGGQRQT